jgi:hypothetical protein
MALIPFDYAATFQLVGEPGRVHEDVISISPESPFIAYAVSYGLEEERGRPVSLENLPDAPFPAGNLRLGTLPVTALIDGVRLHPRERMSEAAVGADGSLFEREYTAATAPRLLQRLKPPQEVSFLFSLIDTASGRELQDEPANNLASLGRSTGGRPFRLLARPLAFQPRSTIRVQVIERSQDVRGVLFIVLQGYKQLGGPRLTGRSSQSHHPGVLPRPGRPPGRGMVPFDYVVSLDLEGRPGSVVSEEITISVDGAFVATHIGYGLEAGPSRAVPVQLPPGAGDIALANLPLRSFPESALADGIRIRPDFHRIAMGNGGGLAAAVRRSLVGQIFETLNRPEDVQFRYSIFDGGRGRELQDRPVFNLAGLGSADGDRPFKRLPSPLVFLPRSTLRVSVEERFGRGTLYFALQGYKASARGSRRP